MRPIATDVARNVVYLSGTRHTSELCKNGWSDRESVWGLTHMGPRNHVLDGGPDPPREWALLRGECAVPEYIA